MLRIVRIQLKFFENKFLKFLSSFPMNENTNLVHDLDDGDEGREIKKAKVDDEEIATEEKKTLAQQVITKFKNKKFVVCLSYCGHGYYGMQRQAPGHELPTIEDDLLKAFLQVGVIKEEGYQNLSKIYFQRAARTDKGVSAVKQVISLKLPDEFDKLVPEINKLLPKQIRVISGKRVTKYFDSKNFCDARTYHYLMPTFAISPIDKLTSEEYRITPEIIKEFNEILSIYKGTHNFHNFTAHKAPNDNSAFRYIIEISCGQSFVKDDIEFVIVRVKGQSFMLHQIRKMLGLAIAIMKGYASKDTIERAFQPPKLDIPKAPGLGLMLYEIHYDRYNKRYGGDGVHERIDWEEYADVINEFKQNCIYPIIVETEKNEKSMLTWMQTLQLHTYDVREPGPPAKIPDLKEKLKEKSGSVYLGAIINLKKNQPDSDKDDKLNDEKVIDVNS